jgi:hypothetical protein
MYALSELNYLAILVTAVLIFVLGAIWYSVLFGKAWMAAHGYTPEQLEGMRSGMARAYGLSFVCYLVLSTVLALLIALLGLDSWMGGAKLGAICWLGFVATIGFTSYLYSNKNITTWMIDAAYQLLFLVGAGAILAVW